MASNEVIDLTTSSPPPQPELKPVSTTSGNASISGKVEQPSYKKKRGNQASSTVNGTSEQSDAPQASVEPPRPLTGPKEATQPAVLQRTPPPKRKRDHADHGPEADASPTEAASADRDRPGPLKRHKSDQSDRLRKASTLTAPVTPVVDASVTSETAKAQKKKRSHGRKARRPKDAKTQDNARDKEEGELTETEVNKPPSTNGSSRAKKESRKRSKSPSRLVPEASGKKRKEKSKPASGHKATSDTESVNTPTSHMFFVDLDPAKDVVYEVPEVKPKYQMEQGNLLLPHHVLLETTEEQQFSLSAVEVPPTDDTDSGTEDDFQLIEDTNGVCFTFRTVDLLFRIFLVSTIL